MGTEPLTPRSTRVKAARKLTRRAFRMSEGLFLAEGPQAVREAFTVPGCVVEVFSTYDGQQRHPEISDAARRSGVDWHLVDDKALASLAETVSPQGVVAVCTFVDSSLEQALDPPPRLVAMCANVRDPGNAGTVIRCADAAGADATILAGTSVDPYNGKVVRASAGSLFHLPVVFAPSVAESVQALRTRGLVVLAADGAAEQTLDDVQAEGVLAGPTAWMFGNEAWGLSEQEASVADHVVRVPIYGKAESLNLATAAAVCLYASAREHRQTGGGD